MEDGSTVYGRVERLSFSGDDCSVTVKENGQECSVLVSKETLLQALVGLNLAVWWIDDVQIAHVTSVGDRS